MVSIKYALIVFLSLVCIFEVGICEDIKFTFATTKSDDVIHDAEVQVGKTITLNILASSVITDFPLIFKYEDGSNKDQDSTDKITVSIKSPSYQHNKTRWRLKIHGDNAGHVTLVVQVNTTQYNTTDFTVSDAFVRFQVYHSEPLTVLSDVIGWIYFVAWSISFYPQVYLNWRRKSVIGLNFDFLGLNLAGFLCYSIYNVGLFWIKPIKDEFRENNPHDILPVEPNDVVFALHAVLLTLITIIQVFIYERGGQKVSIIARIILSACTLAMIVIIIVAAVPSVTTFKWLEMVTALSYIKLGITIIKYIPQAWMNFRRKSTVGWSIGNVLLDFTGGFCSIVQMFILAYNFDDWHSIFLNPVKFWLGALSIFFDVIFITQHYCLYRNHSQEYVIQRDEPDN